MELCCLAPVSAALSYFLYQNGKRVEESRRSLATITNLLQETGSKLVDLGIEIIRSDMQRRASCSGFERAATSSAPRSPREVREVRVGSGDDRNDLNNRNDLNDLNGLEEDSYLPQPRTWVDPYSVPLWSGPRWAVADPTPAPESKKDL